MMDKDFILDPRLAKDSLFLTKLALCEVRLMADSRWPWLLLVPAIADVTEVFALDEEHRARLCQETAKVSQALKSITQCDKINIATLGNIVNQLHIHVVARFIDDANWPNPIWGYGQACPYDEAHQHIFCKALKEALSKL